MLDNTPILVVLLFYANDEKPVLNYNKMKGVAFSTWTCHSILEKFIALVLFSYISNLETTHVIHRVTLWPKEEVKKDLEVFF